MILEFNKKNSRIFFIKLKFTQTKLILILENGLIAVTAVVVI